MIFSIAIPVFKQADLLPTALASLLVQKPALQLAVVDATPDDSVQAVMADYAGRVHYARHGPDRGQSAAIQEGWDNTSGEIVHWLCADDYLFPYALEEVEKVFRQHPDVDVVYGDSVFVNKGGEFIRYFPSISQDISNIVADCCISQPSCFVRRTAVEQVGNLNQELHYIMDWDLWTRLFKAGAKFHYLHKPLSATRIYKETKTSSNSERRFAEIRNHLAKHTDYVSALRSMAGFQMVGRNYAEFGVAQPSPHIRTLAAALTSLSHIKKGFTKNEKKRKGKNLYGLDTLTNQVQKCCQVYLPTYRSAPPTEIVVSTSERVSLNATIDGIGLPLSADTGQEPNQSVFRIPHSVGNGQHYFQIALDSPQQAPWQLISVNLM